MIRFEKGSPEEERKIQILKTKFHDRLPPALQRDQTIYYRFLKARDFDLDLADKMLENHISDYKVYSVQDVATYVPPEHIQEYYSECFLGYDKEGTVVRYFDCGKFDYKGVFSTFTFVEMSQYHSNMFEDTLEKMTAQSKKLGKSITQFVYIINADKMSLYVATYKKGMETVMRAHKLIQDNYPERIKAVYVINASVYFHLAYSILKHVYAKALLEKIHIFRKDDWKDFLLSVIDADELPAFLGGNKTDPDGNPLCNSFVVHGKKVPEKLYEKKYRKPLSEEAGVKKLILARFASTQLTFDVDDANSYLEWEFETKIRDIGFALYYKNSSKAGSKLEEKIPKQRIDTASSSEVGVIKCEKIGTYIIEFDNSYSWFFSKEIFYRIKVVKKSPSEII